MTDSKRSPARAQSSGGAATPAIGLVFETFGAYPARAGDPPDAEAEYEPEATIACIERAFERLGWRCERIGTPRALLERIAREETAGLAAALCIAEGHGARNREAWGPVLLEMAGVPMLGSDPLTLSLSLDKAWTHRHLRAAGIPVPPHTLIANADDAERAELPAPFPLFVKPRWEGTAKGVRAESRVSDRTALVREVARVTRDYRQPALVEAFLPGAEYTVTVVGCEAPHALPVLQRALDRDTGIGIHALEGPGRAPRALEAVTPGVLEEALEKELQTLAVRVFRALECRDFARLDFKCDASDRPYFLEINTLPTFDPAASFGIHAELEGRAPDALLADVLAPALARLGLREAPGVGPGAPGREPRR